MKNIIIIAFILLVWRSQSGCSPVTQLDKFYQTSISIMEMYKDASNTKQTRYIYIYNIPTYMLQNKGTEPLSTNMAILQMSGIFTTQSISYQLSHYRSQTAILIAFQQSNAQWQKLLLSLFINNPSVRPQIYFGEHYYNSSENTQKQFAVSGQIASQQKYQKIIHHIIGIKIQQTIFGGQLYQISVNSEINQKNKYSLGIKIGNTNKLSYIKISYIAFKNIQTNDYKIVTGSVVFGSKTSGQQFSILSDSLPTTHNYIVGIGEIQFRQNYKQFGIDIGIPYHNVMNVTFIRPVDYIKINYFGIGVTALNACGRCQVEKYLYSQRETSACLPKCPSDTKIQQLKNGGKLCVECPTQLNMILRDGGCFCQIGFKQFDGRCIPQTAIPLVPVPTFSVQQSDCIDPNSIKSNGDCICKKGYKKDSRGTCISECGYGYWDQFLNNCVFCNFNTFPDEYSRQCRKCSQNCEMCQSTTRCGFCKIGFIANVEGQCREFCGDGQVITDQCDDGNDKNDDGCSSTCKIQKGYKCQGGNLKTKSVCRPIKYALRRQSSQSTVNGYIINYILQPSPELLTNQQLKQIATVQVTDAQAQTNPKNLPKDMYYQVYPTQDPINLQRIRILLYFGHAFPTFNFRVTTMFKFPNGEQLIDSSIANMYASNSYFSARRDSGNLT